jgi:hypothetical protein
MVQLYFIIMQKTIEERTSRQTKSVLNKSNEQNNLTGSEHGDPMFSRCFPSAKSLLRKQALLMEPLHVLQFCGRCWPDLHCYCQFWVFRPAICQSTSFALMLPLFVLGPFPIQSGASLKVEIATTGWRRQWLLRGHRSWQWWFTKG